MQHLLYNLKHICKSEPIPSSKFEFKQLEFYGQKVKDPFGQQ